MQGQFAERGIATLECGTGLVEKLEATRQGMHAFQYSRCLLVTTLVVLALAGLVAGADWYWVLGTTVRAVGLLALGTVALVLLGRGLVPARRFARPDAAAEVEDAFPELGQRVRTTLEYVEPAPNTAPAAPALVRALVTDTERHTQPLDFRNLIPWRSLRWLTAGLVGLGVIFLALLCANGELRTAALRLFLVPVHYTHLEVKPGDQCLKVGNDLTVEAALTGRPVRNAELRYRPNGSSDEWKAVSLAPPGSTGPQKLLGNLETTLKDCQTDLEYRIVAGLIESPLYRVTILRPLVLKQVEATVAPPAYTRRPAVVAKEGNFKVVAGSKVRFRFTLDREPKSAKLLLYPAAAKVEAEHAPPPELLIHGNELVGELPAIDKELEYDLVAEATDGMRLDPKRFRIQVQPDRKPTVRFIKPQEQIEVTPTTEVHMKIEASDDFGLAAVSVVFQIGSGPKKTLYLGRDPAQPTTLTTEVVLPLEEHGVGFQDSVTYYAFAEDNHPEQAQRTTTELQFIDIRPYKREYQLLKTGGS